MPTGRPVWTKAGGGAGEGRPEQKVRTAREFKEMFFIRLPSMGVSTPLGRSGTGGKRWEQRLAKGSPLWLPGRLGNRTGKQAG